MIVDHVTDNISPHDFHIPVMGTAFTIDTPYKVARFGISSVVSIGDDELCETMRQYYCAKHNRSFSAIEKSDPLYRSKRICAYLNLLNELVNDQIHHMKSIPFSFDSDNTKYFDLLPDDHSMKAVFNQMKAATGSERLALEARCRDYIRPGAIDVNIMTKLDRINYDADNRPLPKEYCDAVSALRGFADSDLSAGVVFSAGFNGRLFSFCDTVKDFLFVDGVQKKRIILKVSDFRSSFIQGRYLAKKGIWVSEYRVESGLNCGGHAFATNGLLCGPILEEFKDNLSDLSDECRDACNQVLSKKELALVPKDETPILTYQGGVGTTNEQSFLMKYYNVKSVGWGTPFLLVPEATTLDTTTRELLQKSTSDDCYLSEISPLGVPFNAVRNTLSDEQKHHRIDQGRPGSPCPKGYLISNTEFSKKPVCTASMFYQRRKIALLKSLNLMPDDYKEQHDQVVNKSCLCEDLAAPALSEYGLENGRPLKSTVCAGPNIAYYTKITSLKDMISHIYGRCNLIVTNHRPSFFITELNMYVKHFKGEIKSKTEPLSQIDTKRLVLYARNLFDGIQYYIQLTKTKYIETDEYKQRMLEELTAAKNALDQLVSQYQNVFSISPHLAMEP